MPPPIKAPVDTEPGTQVTGRRGVESELRWGPADERRRVGDSVWGPCEGWFDGGGNVIGIEILDASKRMGDPMSVEYAIAR